MRSSLIGSALALAIAVGQAAAEPATPVSIPSSPGAWQQSAQHNGRIYAAQNGLVLQGGAWTNGRLKDGFYDGNRVWSAQTFDFSRGGDVYLRFLLIGGGQYMVIWPRLFEGVSVRPLTTHHSFAGSIAVPENTWLFAHLSVQPDGSYRAAVARRNYDDRGGQILSQDAGQLANPRGRIEMQFADNYAGTKVLLVINEVVVAARTSTVPDSLPDLPPPE
jgi:hypothetical protein